MSEYLYVVMCLIKEHDVEIGLLNCRKTLEIRWSDGMIGILPVFKSKEDAERYADGRFGVERIEVIEKGENE